MRAWRIRDAFLYLYDDVANVVIPTNAAYVDSRR